MVRQNLTPNSTPVDYDHGSGDSGNSGLVELFLEITISCDENEVFDTVLYRCRILSFPDQNVSEGISSGSGTPACKTIALNDSEFEYFGENMVLFRGEILEIQSNTSEGKPEVCTNFTRNGEAGVVNYPRGYDEITFIGCGASFASCCLVLITFSLFKELRTFPSKILMNVTVTILISNLVMIVTVSGGVSNSVFCEVFAILRHFITLSQFMWMPVMWIEVAYSFHLASRLIPSDPDTARRKLVIYGILSWSIPFAIVTICVVLNYSTSDLLDYGKVDRRICWIRHFNSAIVTYVLPAVVCTLLQCILFLLIGYYLCQSFKRKDVEVSTQSKHIPFFRILFSLFFATNIVWVLGFVALLVRTSWSWYPFTILQSFQGAVIFAGFFCTKKVFNLYTTHVFSPLKTKFLTSLTSLLYT